MRMHRIFQITACAGLILCAAGARISCKEKALIKKEAQKQIQTEAKIKAAYDTDTKEPDAFVLSTLNPDYRAFLEFDSGLIRLPVVQTGNNSFYLDHLFDGSEGITGTLFFDVQCEAEDPVKLIYGHSVFDAPSLMFTPLHGLLDPHFCEENRSFRLITRTRKEHYEIIAVLINDEDDPDCIQTRIRRFADPREEYLWLNEAVKRSCVSLASGFTGQERILILQTCARAEGALRLIVIAVEK